MDGANNSWRFDVDGQGHEVNLDVSLWGKWTVSLDGKVVVEDRKWLDNEETFEIGRHTVRVKVHPTLGGFSQGSELFLDGSYVEPLRR
jgi:hypothetical protein